MPPRVLGRELDVVALLARVRDNLGHARQALRARHARLLLEGEMARRRERLDARAVRPLDRLPRALDVDPRRAGEPADDRRQGAQCRRTADLAGDRAHGLEVTGGRRWKAGLDDIYAEPRQRARDLELLGVRHRRARRLLAVAQRGVEDSNIRAVGHNVGIASGYVAL